MDLGWSFSWMTSKNDFFAHLLVVQQNFSFICKYPSNWAAEEQGMAPSRPRKNRANKCWFCEQQRLVCFNASHFSSLHPCRGALSYVLSWLSPWGSLEIGTKTSPSLRTAVPDPPGLLTHRAAGVEFLPHFGCWVSPVKYFLIHVNRAKQTCTKPRISTQPR